MNKVLRMMYLIVLLSLIFSCVERNSTEEEGNEPQEVQTLNADTLKFTSGVRAIFQDSKGRYWFGSHNEGVGYYDGRSFKYFTVHEGLSDNQIRSIQEDENGKIWVGTAKGVSVYDEGKFTNYSTDTKKPKYEWNETNGDLWFYAGEEGGINRFDGIHMNYLIFPKPRNEHPDDTYGVTDIAKDNHGNVWIATYAALFNYDGKSVNIFDHKDLNLAYNDRLHVRSVFADSKGRIWIGNNGIGVLFMEGDSIIHFSEKYNLIHPTSSRRGDPSEAGTLEHIFAIGEDSEGNIWFGDRDTGAWKYDGMAVTNYTIDKKLKSQMIWTMYTDHSNTLLFGMGSGGVYKYNGQSFERAF